MLHKVLAAQNRLRRSADFKTTVRSGGRFGRRNLVLSAVARPSTAPTTFGFIVAKSVGNAVKRNLVKRRLRALAACELQRYPVGLAVVVRALPAAAHASWLELAKDYQTAIAAGTERLGIAALTAEKGCSE